MPEVAAPTAADARAPAVVVGRHRGMVAGNGVVWTALQADAVALFASLQVVGLRRARR